MFLIFCFLSLSLTSDVFGMEDEDPSSLSSVKQQLEEIKSLDAMHPSRKKVTILGAGMAGLCAAYELSKLGHVVEIIEATNRVGGRVWTHKFESSGQYGELGAMRIPDNHDYTHHYIGVAGLTKQLRPFVNAHENQNCFYHLRGHTIRMREASEFLSREYNLSSQEADILKDKAPPEILGRHLVNALETLEATSASAPKKTWGGLLGETFLNDYALSLEELSLGEFLKKRKESTGAQELIGVTTGLELWWDKALTMFLREGITGTGDKLKEIAGGLSTLPNELARLLRGSGVKFRMNTEVLSIDISDGTQQNVKFRTRPTDPSKWDSPPTTQEPQDEVAEYVICTLPFGVLRTMELKGLSPIKMEAIRNLTYANSTKVLLNFTDRFWERGPKNTQILGGASMSDQIIRCTYYPSDHAQVEHTIPKKKFTNIFTVASPLKIKPTEALSLKQEKKVPGVLLGSYNWGQDALRLGMHSPEERAEIVIKELEKIHPEIREHLDPKEGHMSISWDYYRWSQGAFCGHRPNDMRFYYHASRAPERNLFFAGEHCSLDNGWIQGAIKSGLHAVEELLKKGK